MAPSPRLLYLVTDQAPPFLEWNSMLNFDHVGTNPIVTSEWIKVFTAKKIFGLVFIRYINDLIICRYIVASTYSDEASLNSFRFDAIGVVMALQSIIVNLFRISTAYFHCPHVHA